MNPEDINKFLFQFSKFEKHAPKSPVKRAYISIGSNLFIDMGNYSEEKDKKGRLFKEYDWSLWMSFTQWRLTKGDKYLAGSCDSTSQMNEQVSSLIGEKLISTKITSQFMDICFHFTSNLCIETFCDGPEEQWLIHEMRNGWLAIDLDGKKGFSDTKELSTHFNIKENFQSLDLPILSTQVESISLNECLALTFENELQVSFDLCSWRLEQNGNFICSEAGDYEDNEEVKKEICQYLEKLTHLKLQSIRICNKIHDTVFEFENGYQIKTFACYYFNPPWSLLDSDGNEIYVATFSI